ncbi:MAG: transposase, partial [Deltaproteobacteria bacterium]|nr:transposase [Deltaproteobacteria bacterium]
MERLLAELDLVRKRLSREVGTNRGLELINERRLEQIVGLLNDKVCLLTRIGGFLARLATPAADTTNSGMPPSQNPLAGRKLPRGKSAPEGKDGKAKSRGGVPGHPRSLRTYFDLAEADFIDPYCYDADGIPNSPCCGGEMRRFPDKDRQQDIYEFPEKRSLKRVEPYHAYRCVKCGKIHYSEEHRGGFMGSIVSPGIVAEMLYLNLNCHVTIRKPREFFEIMYGMRFCHSFVNKCLKRAAFVLLPVFLEIIDALKLEIVLCIDEGRHNYKGKLKYIWIFRGKKLVGFRIGTRSRDMLDRTLGPDFSGAIVSDHFAVFPSFHDDHPKILSQYCLAHLRRDFAYCADYIGPGHEDLVRFWKKGAELLDALFHEYNEDRRILASGDDAPETAAARRERLLDLRARLWAR